MLVDLSLVDTLPGEYLCGQSIIAVKAHPQVRCSALQESYTTLNL
jgi:hypothetical protein